MNRNEYIAKLELLYVGDRNCLEELITTYDELENENKQLKDNWNELKKWLEEEKDSLAREYSSIYEDDLGKTRFVNEDIYNEVKNISNKMQELEGKSE